MSFLSDAEIVISELENFYQDSLQTKKPTLNQVKLAEIIDRLDLANFVFHGGLHGEKLNDFVKQYLDVCTRLHHPAYIGHQVAVPHYAGALASLINGFTNNSAAIYEMGPGASAIEFYLMNWMLEKVGWNPSPYPSQGKLTAYQNGEPYGGGVLTNGGSLANLTALLAARQQVAPDIWKKGLTNDLALLASEGSHYSVTRAAGILGIGQDNVYHLAQDEQGMIVPEKLSTSYQKAIGAGKKVIALVANACNTAVGTYDPLQRISAFCRRYDIWLHVDGAHGASALLSDKYKECLKGIEEADSLTWDAHKLMRTPTLCAALLFKDHRHLDNLFEQEASYLFHERNQPGFDFGHRTIECTKSAMALKLFMVIAALGEKGLADYIDRQYELTMQAYYYINEQPDFICPVRPQSNILCFRTSGSDKQQLFIRDQLHMRTSYYITTTRFRGRRYLRLTIMNPHTRLQEIISLVRNIRDIYKNITVTL